MMNDKAYYVESFKNNPFHVEPDQDFTVRAFEPGDEFGVARLYYAVYDKDYPVDDYYIPQRILEMNREKSLCSVVCKTNKGEIIGHGAIYQSSPPYPRLMEIGQYLVLKTYRKSGIANQINDYLHNVLISQVPADALYGEAVTNHTVTQNFDTIKNMIDVAIELSLLPPGSGREGAAGRVSCVYQTITLHDDEQIVYVPPCYESEIDFIVTNADFKRRFQLSADPLPTDRKTQHQTQLFKEAIWVRFMFSELGGDFPSVIDRLESQSIQEGCVTFQAFLNMDDVAVGAATEELRKRGWIMGGYLPRWFNHDGFLMQKILERPDFDSIQLYTQKAKDLLNIIKNEFDGSRRES